MRYAIRQKIIYSVVCSTFMYRDKIAPFRFHNGMCRLLRDNVKPYMALVHMPIVLH